MALRIELNDRGSKVASRLLNMAGDLITLDHMVLLGLSSQHQILAYMDSLAKDIDDVRHMILDKDGGE